MRWCRSGDKLLPEPMMTKLIDVIMSDKASES